MKYFLPRIIRIALIWCLVVRAESQYHSLFKKVRGWAQKRIIDTVKIKTAKILRAKIYQITVVSLVLFHSANMIFYKLIDCSTLNNAYSNSMFIF